jgi:hypothetical protein
MPKIGLFPSSPINEGSPRDDEGDSAHNNYDGYHLSTEAFGQLLELVRLLLRQTSYGLLPLVGRIATGF